MLATKASSCLMYHKTSCLTLTRLLSSAQLAHALRPFYFMVHPDLFHQHPDQKNVNEGSLKYLQSHFDDLLQAKRTSAKSLNFYVRNNINVDKRKAAARVRISLSSDLLKTVRSVLETCQLPTTYLDSLPPAAAARPRRPPAPAGTQADWMHEWDAEPTPAPRRPDTLFAWLSRTGADARRRLAESARTRSDVDQLRAALVSRLRLTALDWRCGWGTAHCRGCLRSFDTLVGHHPDIVPLLTGRTLVFGSESGVSLDGHLILNSGEVITNWLSVIRQCADHKRYLRRIPHLQRALSRQLRDISVVHRKFQPITMVTSYEQQLRRLVTSMGDFWGRHGYPAAWPQSLHHLQLVVESESGPLFLSPTGQIIAPSSCPPSLLVRFITESMIEAARRLDEYERLSVEEAAVMADTQAALRLQHLSKQDNISPAMMLACCRRLLSHQHRLADQLEGYNVTVAQFYSLDADGACCLPWDWKD